MAQDPIVTFDSVSFRYDGPLVLEDVNLAIPDKGFVCVIGPNGGGKTTFVKLIVGLIEPHVGRISVLGQPPKRVCRRVGYMPQRAELDPEFPVSVVDVVLMGRLGLVSKVGPYRRSDKVLAVEVLEEVGLADLARRPFSSLSGGQRQRTLIARALACEPDMLVFDEPTASLDPAVQDDLYRLLRVLNERLTVIIVSHDVGFVSAYFTTVVCVNRSVHVHPASELTEQRVADMYGREVRYVHHGCATCDGDRL